MIYKEFYVDISNSYLPLSAATVSNGVITYPDFDGYGSIDKPMNWYQFMGSLANTKHTTSTNYFETLQDSVTASLTGIAHSEYNTVVYRLNGARVIDEDDVVWNGGLNYIINIGFTADNVLNDAYAPLDSYITHNVITNWNSGGLIADDPYFIQCGVEGGNVRFRSYSSSVHFMNGMIQTGDGGTQGGSLMFERYVYNSSPPPYIGMKMPQEYITQYSGGYKYPSTITYKSSDVNLFEFDNMWITSNNGLYLTGSRFAFYNSFIRSAHKVSFVKNFSNTINFHNCIVTFHDYSLADEYSGLMANNPNKQNVDLIRPISFSGGCAVSQTEIGALDTSKVFISTYGEMVLEFQRADIFNSPQTISNLYSTPPLSIATSAITNLGTSVLNYMSSPWNSLSAVSINTRATAGNQYYGIGKKTVIIRSWPNNGAIVNESDLFLRNSVGSTLCSTSDAWFNAVYDDGTPYNSVHRDGIGPLYFPGFNYDISNPTIVHGYIGGVEYTPYVDCDVNLLEVGDSNTYYAKDELFKSHFNPTLYEYVSSTINGTNVDTGINTNTAGGVDIYTSADNLTFTGTVPSNTIPIVLYHSFNRWYRRSVYSRNGVKYVANATYDFYIKDMNGNTIDPTSGVMYAGRKYSIVITNTTISTDTTTPMCDSLLIEINKFNPSCEQKFTPSVGGIAYAGGTTTYTFTPSKPTRWTNVDVVTRNADGSYSTTSKRYNIQETNRLYYVDISSDYESSVEVLDYSTRAYDTFTDGQMNYNWLSPTVERHFVVKNINSDWSLVNIDDYETQLISLSATADDTDSFVFDYKFSMIRSDISDVIYFIIKDPENIWNINIAWEYLNSRIKINKIGRDGTADEYIIPYSSKGYAYDLRCDSALRSIDCRITNENGGIEFYYGLNGTELVQYDSDFGTIGGLIANVFIKVIGGTNKSGFGYFDLNANYGFDMVRGSQEYPMTFTQFRDFIIDSKTVKYGDIFKLRGYRSINMDKFGPIQSDDLYFMDWDNSVYGPWIFNFKNPTKVNSSSIRAKYTVDLSKVSMYNGIIYNSYSNLYYGTLIIRKLYDVMLTWKTSNGVNGAVVCKPTYRRDSKALTYNMYGSTFSQY